MNASSDSALSAQRQAKSWRPFRLQCSRAFLTRLYETRSLLILLWPKDSSRCLVLYLMRQRFPQPRVRADFNNRSHRGGEADGLVFSENFASTSAATGNRFR